jgi:hypothetical protein
VQSTDVTELSMRLAQLADALGGKPPTAAAMKVWYDALAECAMPDVLAVLTDWPKTHAKAPVPMEVLKLSNERISSRLERESKDRARESRQPWSPEKLQGDQNSAAYQQFKRDFAALRARKFMDPEARAERQAIRDEAVPF